jgi:methionyl-tRNA synthetase
MIITTAIDYPNALPHIGTAYEKVLADIQCRGIRLMGHEAKLLMGVDENTAKVEKRAAELKMGTQEYADLMADQFLHCWNALDIKHDYFVRTSSVEHRKLVEDFIAKVRTHSPGAIYWGEYESLYCDGCEEHKTVAKLENKRCPAHPQLELRLFKEPCWMFRLTQFQQEVFSILTHPRSQYSSGPMQVTPDIRKNEAVALLQNTHDMCISREMNQVTALLPKYSKWGIPFPVDGSVPKSWIVEHQCIYVWFDALISYLHAGTTPAIHHIGKDINRFHTNLWPAMLLAAKQPLPIQIMIHGFILCNGDKASKTTMVVACSGVGIG